MQHPSGTAPPPRRRIRKYLWSGASGSSVHLYATANTTWRVKVCQAGSATVCSPERSITLSN